LINEDEVKIHANDETSIANEINVDATDASIEETKEMPALSGKFTISIESAKLAGQKSQKTSVGFEWNGEKLSTTTKNGNNPKWNEVSSN
jgi:hypothetical protein